MPSRGAWLSWLTADFPNATIAGLCIAAIAVAMFLDVLLQPASVISDLAGTHIAVGNWIIAHHTVPRTDPFTWTMAGQPWQASEWLAELLIAFVYRVSGWGGLVLLAAVSMAATVLIVSWSAARRLVGIPLLIAVGLSVCNLDLIDAPRPHFLVLPLLASWVAGLLIARERDCAPPFWLAGLMVLWVNMHGSFIFGLFLTLPFALEAVIETSPSNRRRAAIQWGLFTGTSLFACLSNPYGFDALTYPFWLTSIKELAGFAEWSPLYQLPALPKLNAFLGILLGAALVLPLRVPPIRAAIIIALLVMTLAHIRHAPLLAMVAPMLLAGPIAKAIEQKQVIDWSNAVRVAMIVVFAVVAIFGGARLAVPFERPETPLWPVSAVRAVPPMIRSRHVYNEAATPGPYLIFMGIAPAFDDRVELFGDTVWPAAGPFDYRWLDENGVDWTIVVPESSLSEIQDHDPKWVRIYEDQFAVVHVRKSVWDAYKAGAKS